MKGCVLWMNDRHLCLRNFTSPAYRHVLLLLHWPVFGLLFFCLELFRPAADCYSVRCALDKWIPFCEWFLIPYLAWFLFLPGMLGYLFFRDTRAFSNMMKFIIFTYGVTMVIYLLFPTRQDLRPAVFPRDNSLTRFMAAFYAFDTNTNVCPSIHVLGSMAAGFGALDAGTIRSKGAKAGWMGLALLISVSVVFVKQHSVIDLGAGLALSALGWVLVYGKTARKRAYRTSLKAPRRSVSGRETA